MSNTAQDDYLKWLYSEPDEFFAQDDGDLMAAGFKAGRNAGLEALRLYVYNQGHHPENVVMQVVEEAVRALKTAETEQR